MSEANRTGNKALLGVRSKFIKVHVTSPHVHSLVEVLKSPEVSALSTSENWALTAVRPDRVSIERD